MSWIRSEPEPPLLRTIEIDKVIKPFRIVTLINLALLATGVRITAVVLADLFTGQLISFEWVYVLPFLFAAGTAWKNIDVLHSIVQPLTVTSLLVLGIPCSFFFVLYVVLATNGTFEWSSQEFILATYNFAFFGTFGIASAIAIIRLRRRDITALGLKLTEFMRLADPPSHRGEIKSAPAKNARLGRWLLAAGFATLLFYNVVQDIFPVLQGNRQWLRVSEWTGYLAFYLLLRARAQFQPRAETLLTVDPRPPVLFLRSFSDDERIIFQKTENALFDFSLELRLAGHFSRKGPFIAVGSPNHERPAIGAARASLSDAEWQGKVADWMGSAVLILVMAGTTHWIGWELRQIIDRGLTGKLILLFPQTLHSKMRFRWRIKLISVTNDAEARLDAVRSAFQGTPWKAQLDELNEPLNIRSLIFGANGHVTMVRARSRSRNAYHLAALIADYFLMNSGQDRMPLPVRKAA